MRFGKLSYGMELPPFRHHLPANFRRAVNIVSGPEGRAGGISPVTVHVRLSVLIEALMRAVRVAVFHFVVEALPDLVHKNCILPVLEVETRVADLRKIGDCGFQRM